MLKPTPHAYGELQQAFDHFNASLFDDALPPCLITLQCNKRFYGYFANDRFAHRHEQRTVHEIALNPAYFATRSIRETLGELAHSMVHERQQLFGAPGRRGYHNREWADMMEEIGLMPSDTGAPGGQPTGERMSQYVIDGGRFARACDDLLTEAFTLSWVNRYTSLPLPKQGRGARSAALVLPAPGSSADFELDRSNRVKFRCPICSQQAWGKPDLKLLCGKDECKACPLEPFRAY